jgi:ADP-ribose pyrophosphatase
MAKETKYQGKYLRMVNDDTWEYVERVNCSGVVIIIPVTNDKKVILIEQFRKAINNKLIEFPAGLVGDTDSEEKIELAANRELEEETGYTAEKMFYLFDTPVSAGLTSETVSFVWAENIKRTSDGGGVDGENIIVHEIELEKVNSWLKEKQKEGFSIDAKVYSGLYIINNINDFK